MSAGRSDVASVAARSSGSRSSAPCSVGGAFAVVRGIRALDVVKSALVGLAGDDPALAKMRWLTALGIAVGALFVDALAQGLADALGKRGRALGLAGRRRREPVAEVTIRLRKARPRDRPRRRRGPPRREARARAGTQRAVLLASYARWARFTSRLATGIGYLLLDVIFDNSTRLARLESPLRYLGEPVAPCSGSRSASSITAVHHGGDVGRDAPTPDTWLSQAGGSARIIAIVYASRVLVEDLRAPHQRPLPREGGGEEPPDAPAAKDPGPRGHGLRAVRDWLRRLSCRAARGFHRPHAAARRRRRHRRGHRLRRETFVGDIVAGFFILFENLLLVGDLVEIGGIQGAWRRSAFVSRRSATRSACSIRS